MRIVPTNTANLFFIRKLIDPKIPLILDAGIGSTKDATETMEMGFDGVLLNSAISLHSQKPEMMAQAMKYAVQTGRLSYLAGKMESKIYATASSI